MRFEHPWLQSGKKELRSHGTLFESSTSRKLHPTWQGSQIKVITEEPWERRTPLAAPTAHLKKDVSLNDFFSKNDVFLNLNNVANRRPQTTSP